MRFVGRQTTEQILLKNKRIYREHICCAYKNIFFWINWDDKNNKTNNILLSIYKTRVRGNSKRLTYWVNFAQWIHYNWKTWWLVHPKHINICQLFAFGLDTEIWRLYCNPTYWRCKYLSFESLKFAYQGPLEMSFSS